MAPAPARGVSCGLAAGLVHDGRRAPKHLTAACGEGEQVERDSSRPNPRAGICVSARHTTASSRTRRPNSDLFCPGDTLLLSTPLSSRAGFGLPSVVILLKDRVLVQPRICGRSCAPFALGRSRWSLRRSLRIDRPPGPIVRLTAQPERQGRRPNLLGRCSRPSGKASSPVQNLALSKLAPTGNPQMRKSYQRSLLILVCLRSWRLLMCSRARQEYRNGTPKSTPAHESTT